MTVGELIKQRREELGLTQEQLAKIMGYKYKSSIGNAEKKGNDFTIKSLEKFAKALHCSTKYFSVALDKKEKTEINCNVNDVSDYICKNGEYDFFIEARKLNDEHRKMIEEQIKYFQHLESGK